MTSATTSNQFSNDPKWNQIPEGRIGVCDSCGTRTQPDGYTLYEPISHHNLCRPCGEQQIVWLNEQSAGLPERMRHIIDAPYPECALTHTVLCECCDRPAEWQLGGYGYCAEHYPLCVRPDHLFLGTDKDNMDDMRSKGREHFTAPPHKNIGESNPRARLTEKQVQDIRSLYKKGKVTYIELAAKFQVSHGAIADILSYKNWTHLP